MHLDESEVQRLVHGEVAPAVAIALWEHLATCADCAGLVAAAEREDTAVARLLRAVDHAPPRIDVNTLVARAPAAPRAWGRWAAMLLLAAGLAGAAYAAPGSPLRRWIAATVGSSGGRRSGSEKIQPQTPSAAGVSGIAVAPGRALLILFTTDQPIGDARLSLTDGPDVTVRTSIGSATFTSDIGRLLIDNRGSSAGVDIEIPKGANRVEVQVAGRRVFLVQHARVTTTTPPDSAGLYRLSLAAPRS